MTEPTPQTIQDVLEEFLRGAAPTFEPYAQYSREADALYVFTQDVPTYRRRVDGIRHLTRAGVHLAALSPTMPRRHRCPPALAEGTAAKATL